MKNKKKLLFIGIRMDSAGTEKSFLSFLSALDREKYDCELLLCEPEGLFMKFLPPDIKVHTLPCFGSLFTANARTTASTLWRLFVKKNPLYGFVILPYFVKIILCPKKKVFTATRLWVKMMKYLPPLKDALPECSGYDAAIAYWGDRTMFYMIDKVDAKKKISWLHFDYENPPRDNSLYLPYFQKCDAIVTVSEKVDEALRRSLPKIAEKTVMIENITNPEEIHKMAEIGETFPPIKGEEKEAPRLLTVGRLTYQKGTDLIPEILSELKRKGISPRWYLIGTGDESYISELKNKASALGVSDNMILLGTTENPYRYIADCDLYVQPSRYEGKPITVEEAKVLRKYIITASYLSAEEQLKGGYGTVCAADPKALSVAIASYLASPSPVFAPPISGNIEEMRKFDEIVNKL